MSGKHFHTEWSFRVEFTKGGQLVKTCRYLTNNCEPFKTEEAARAAMYEMTTYFDAYIQKHGLDGDYDAFACYSPVPRIVTEWEDATTDEEVLK